MTVVLDSTALLALHVEGPARRTVTDAMDTDSTWSACALALGEAVAAAARLADDPVLARLLEDGIRHTWDFLHVVPVDQMLLDDAADLCRTQPVGFASALHLVAARRLPAPVRYVTFDATQIPVALALGLEVLSG